jgi:hypothetical protein
VLSLSGDLRCWQCSKDHVLSRRQVVSQAPGGQKGHRKDYLAHFVFHGQSETGLSCPPLALSSRTIRLGIVKRGSIIFHTAIFHAAPRSSCGWSHTLLHNKIGASCPPNNGKADQKNRSLL